MSDNSIDKLSDMEQVDILLKPLKAVKSSLKRKDRLSKKRREMSPENHTPRRIQSAEADLNWECMNLDKAKTDFARMFQGSVVDVDTGEKVYNPSGFHKYKH